jgi:hypothetical protein
LDNWNEISEYLIRFLEPLPIGNTHYHEIDEAASTFQHIAIWTVLQFCEKGGKFYSNVCNAFRNNDK